MLPVWKSVELRLNSDQLLKNSEVIPEGFSDHHSFVETFLKCQLVKSNAEAKIYWDYGKFNKDAFYEDLNKTLGKRNVYLSNICPSENALIKKKILKFSYNSFMTKALRKAILHTSKFKDVYHKFWANENWLARKVKTQRNFCVNLFRKTEKYHFQRINMKDLSDNKKIWKTIKPYFSNKGLNSNKLLLNEKGRFSSDEKELENLVNSFFINITAELDLKKDAKASLGTPITLGEILQNTFNNNKHSF